MGNSLERRASYGSAVECKEVRVVLARSQVSETLPYSDVAVETDKIQILGVPLGSAEFAYEYVENELLPTAQKVMAKLANFEDSQTAMYLLRLSYSIVRANHFMRTTPLPQWLNHAKSSMS